MRNLTEHITNPANDKLIIMVADERGAGGANHRYEITGFDASTNPSENNENGTGATRCTILFQNGTIPEKGTNGITQEVLLAIVADRLRIARKKAAGLKAQRNTALVKFAELQEVVDALNNAGQCLQCVRICMNANRREAALAAQSANGEGGGK